MCDTATFLFDLMVIAVEEKLLEDVSSNLCLEAD